MTDTTPALDLDAIAAKWLRQCGACDAGLGMSCTCPPDDPRNAISLLLDEVRRLQALTATVPAAAAGWVSVADILPAKAKELPWTWEDEDRNIRTRQCLCCGRPGHYQELVEAHIVANGIDGLGILVRDGYVADGHHRVVAALRLGIDKLPTETDDDARARWVSDHGHVDWLNRKFGDR